MTLSGAIDLSLYVGEVGEVGHRLVRDSDLRRSRVVNLESISWSESWQGQALVLGALLGEKVGELGDARGSKISRETEETTPIEERRAAESWER